MALLFQAWAAECVELANLAIESPYNAGCEERLHSHRI